MSDGKRKVRVGKLDTVGGVVAEMGKLYREARRGDLDTLDATRLCSVLAEMRRALEFGELERRVLELEARREGTGATYYSAGGAGGNVVALQRAADVTLGSGAKDTWFRCGWASVARSNLAFKG